MTRDENTRSCYHEDFELSDGSRELLEMKTHGHGYHVDLELSDRSWECLDIWIPIGNCIGCWCAGKGSVYGCHS